MPDEAMMLWASDDTGRLPFIVQFIKWHPHAKSNRSPRHERPLFYH